MNYVLTEVHDRIAYLILNRPDKRNALNADFVGNIKEVLRSYQSPKEIRAVVIKSSSDAFCAGADLAYLQQLQNFSYPENLEDSRNLAELFKLIYTHPKPIVSMVKGPALAGGCGLATVCDLCYATPESTFGYTESLIGFVPAIVMVFLRKKAGEALSKKLLFTGEVFKAQKALEYGLINEINEPDIIDDHVHKTLIHLSKKASGNSIQAIKSLYHQLDGLELDQSLEKACTTNASVRASDDCKKGIAAFLNKEKINW